MDNVLDDSEILGSYRANRDTLHRGAYADPSTGFSPYLKARISSNLFHLLPHIDVAKHSSLTKDIYYNQQLASLDLSFWRDLLPLLVAGDNSMERIRNTQGVICSYHYGSYRLLAPYLIQQGIKISILIDYRVDSAQGDLFRTVLDDCCELSGRSAGFYRMRNTSDPNLLRTLLRDVKDGYSVLVYVDGNIGTAGKAKKTSKNQHLVDVSFLGAKLFSRTGFATIAYLSGHPILPVALSREGEKNSFHGYAPIHADGDSRDTFCQRACANIWGILADRLMTEPEQWESWRYVDLSLDLRDLIARHERKPAQKVGEDSPHFNHKRYVLSLEGEEATLYDRISYRIIPVNRPIFDELARVSAEPGYRIENRKLFLQCVDLGVLI